MTKITGLFETRRQAEMAVERLVQEFSLDAGKIRVTAAGDENTAGEMQAGSDRTDGTNAPRPRDDAALEGSVEVAVDVEDEAAARKVKQAFSEFEVGDTAGG